MTITIIIILGAIIIYQGYLINEERIRHNETLTRAQAEHMAERQVLMDRVQAPSFAEYKQQEVKVIKAQNGDKEPPKIEPL